MAQVKAKKSGCLQEKTLEATFFMFFFKTTIMVNFNELLDKFTAMVLGETGKAKQPDSGSKSGRESKQSANEKKSGKESGVANFNELLNTFTDLVTADNVTETPVLDKFTDAVLGGEVAETELKDSRPTIYIWIDDKILSQEKITHLQELIKKAFGYTIFPIGYKLEFNNNRPNWKIFNNEYDIYVYLTDESIGGYVEKYVYYREPGLLGYTPGASDYPIWVYINDFASDMQKYDRTAFVVMHELGHRISQFAYNSVDDIDVSRNYGNIAMHDAEKPNLMMPGDVETYNNLINTGTIYDFRDEGLFLFLQERKKLVVKFLMYLKSKYEIPEQH